MFTGLIQEIGIVKGVASSKGALHLTLEAPELATELQIDDSICMNGVCLTVVARNGNTFEVVAVEETLSKTTLGALKSRDAVNLEPSLRLSDRLGGHLVQGHVDGVGTVAGVRFQQGGVLLTVRVPRFLMRYVIVHGSIAIDGVSLTVARVSEDSVTISLIPHTLERTTLSELKPGDRVNIEVDMVGKYIENLLLREPSGEITEAWLQKLGYE